MPTGKLNGKDVYGVMVSTPIGSDRIMSIIPADFSDEYDNEHLSTDSKLRKRLTVM